MQVQHIKVYIAGAITEKKKNVLGCIPNFDFTVIQYVFSLVVFSFFVQENMSQNAFGVGGYYKCDGITHKIRFRIVHFQIEFFFYYAFL